MFIATKSSQSSSPRQERLAAGSQGRRVSRSQGLKVAESQVRADRTRRRYHLWFRERRGRQQAHVSRTVERAWIEKPKREKLPVGRDCIALIGYPAGNDSRCITLVDASHWDTLREAPAV